MIEKYWKTQNGETLLIKDMKTSHIKNCLKAIEDGKVIASDDYITTFEKELEFREYIKKIVSGVI